MSDFINYPVQLLRVKDRQRVEALLCPAREKHFEDVKQSWRTLFRGSSEADQYWDWEWKQRTYGSRLGAEAYAIECEQRTQGLMLIETLGYRSRFASNRRIVYVHALATAPWNRPIIQAPPKYRAVGSLLLDFAQYRSEELGYGGLVGLHALSGAEGFYRRLKMMDCGSDPEKENLTYFEWYQQLPSVSEEEEDAINWETSESDSEDWQNLRENENDL